MAKYHMHWQALKQQWPYDLAHCYETYKMKSLLQCTDPSCPIVEELASSPIQIQIQIILLHYNVLHIQTEFDPSYGILQ